MVSEALAYNEFVEKRRRACLPSGITVEAAIEEVVRFVALHPELWKDDLRSGIIAVSYSKWPCAG